MLQLYLVNTQSEHEPRNIIPSEQWDLGHPFTGGNARYLPNINASSIVMGTGDLPHNLPIYGWYDHGAILPDGSEYWLLLERGNNNLVWVSENNIEQSPNSNWRESGNQINISLLLDPSQAYFTDDLDIILGVIS